MRNFGISRRAEPRGRLCDQVGENPMDWSDRLVYLIVGFGGVALGLAAVLSVWAVIGDVLGWL